ncbi:MAG TPA: hypothetical protein VFN34_01385 [Ornithinibacter sp.]|nr:hypothetical protein [Ornithinibacter sp.]
MSMTVAVAQAEEAVRELPVPPWLVGVMALLTFAFLLGVTWSFRGTAQKYARPDLEGGRHGAARPGPDHSAADDAPHWPEHPGHQH